MTTEEKIKEGINSLKKYEKTLREIKVIDDTFKETLNSNLYEYQKEFIYNVNIAESGCFVKKCRQVGISTAYAAHLWYKAKTEGEDMGKILICTTSKEMADNTLCKAMQFCSLQEAKILKKRVICRSERNVIDALCGTRYDEIFLDEAAFIKELSSIWDASVPTGAKIIITSTPREYDETENYFTFLFNKVVEHKGSWEYQIINWYESPLYNKNLIWKKIQIEPTINNKGDVVYNKERWEQMLKEGWIPTSPRYEKLVEILGSNRLQELLS